MEREEWNVISLIRNIAAHYREFRQHPNYRGPNFTWIVPLKLAWVNWRASYMWPWERNND